MNNINYDKEFEGMSKEDLIFLLGCYNNYIIDLIGNTKENISIYDFYENEYQDILLMNNDGI